LKSGIELEGITRVVEGEVYLSGLTLGFEPGSFNVLLGRTRSGKTSLLRVLAGLDLPTAGRLLMDGVEVTKLDVRRRGVAMVYQQFVNYPSLTVYENIASPLRRGRPVPKAELDRRVREVAAMLRLEKLLDRLPAELSGGQQQRTAIARALIKDARVLLLDEPLANLDYKLREELRVELQQLFQSRDAIVIYATTEPTEALILGGRTAVLHEGRLLQTGAVSEVYHAPATQQVGQIFSDPEMNLLDVEVAQQQARLSAEVSFPLHGHLAQLPPGRYRLGIRAHHVGLVAGDAGFIRVPVQVELEEISGSETLLHAVHDHRRLTAQLDGVHRHATGTPLPLYLDPSGLFAFNLEGRLMASPPLSPPP